MAHLILYPRTTEFWLDPAGFVVFHHLFAFRRIACAFMTGTNELGTKHGKPPSSFAKGYGG